MRTHLDGVHSKERRQRRSHGAVGQVRACCVREAHRVLPGDEARCNIDIGVLVRHGQGECTLWCRLCTLQHGLRLGRGRRLRRCNTSGGGIATSLLQVLQQVCCRHCNKSVASTRTYWVHGHGIHIDHALTKVSLCSVSIAYSINQVDIIANRILIKD